MQHVNSLSSFTVYIYHWWIMIYSLGFLFFGSFFYISSQTLCKVDLASRLIGIICVGLFSQVDHTSWLMKLQRPNANSNPTISINGVKNILQYSIHTTINDRRQTFVLSLLASSNKTTLPLQLCSWEDAIDNNNNSLISSLIIMLHSVKKI